MNILIMGQSHAKKEVALRKGEYDVISVRGVHRPTDKHFKKEFEKNCRSLLKVYFDDVWLEKHTRQGWVLPTKAQVAEVLEWAKDKDNILVHCKAGKSRSSALGYLIGCMKTGNPEGVSKALLKPGHHIPNELIVQFGAEILDNQEVWDVFARDFPVYGEI